MRYHSELYINVHMRIIIAFNPYV